jgi:lipoprotein NlpI
LFSQAIDVELAKPKPDSLMLSNCDNFLGKIYLFGGSAVLSQSNLSFALDYNPKNEAVLNNFGLWYSMEQFATPDYKKSIDYFDQALAIAPDLQYISLNRAVVKILSGDKSGCAELKQMEGEGYRDATIALERYCAK